MLHLTFGLTTKNGMEMQNGVYEGNCGGCNALNLMTISDSGDKCLVCRDALLYNEVTNPLQGDLSV